MVAVMTHERSQRRAYDCSGSATRVKARAEGRAQSRVAATLAGAGGGTPALGLSSAPPDAAQRGLAGPTTNDSNGSIA